MFTQAEILPWPLSPGGQHRPQWPSQACALSPVPSAGGSSGRRQRMVFGVIACAELDPAAVQDTAIRCLPVPRLWPLLSAVTDLSSGSCADLVTAVCAIPEQWETTSSGVKQYKLSLSAREDVSERKPALSTLFRH